MTINAPAAIIMAFYVVAAEEKGIPADRLSGTIQADILKEYIAQKEWCFPVDPAMRLLGDMMQWSTGHMPRWHPVSISGYHIREAGSTAAQELAFTLKDGLTYVEEQVARGMDVDDFAPRLSFFFNAHIDFFEEIAKYRAARRIWARELKETFGAKNPKSWLMRFHTQTAGVSLTAQQPLNNVARTAIEALAGVLGGTQSLHTNSHDEALALPSEDAVRVALRTQQIIAEETGVTNTIDPLGGSYFVESLTDRMEQLAYEYFAKIDELGGMTEAVKRGYPQREIADAAFELQRGVRLRRAQAGRRELLHGGRRGRDRDPADRPRARAQADRPRPGRPRPPRRRRRRVRAGRAQGRGRAGRPQSHAEPPRLRARTRLRGRDRRSPADRVRHLHRDPRLLAVLRKAVCPMRKLLVATLIAAASAVLATQALAATRSVKVADDYFVRKGSVPTVTVKKGTKVTWRWAGKEMHNVAVTKGPVKFRSSYKDSGTYSKTVRTTGTYTIVCSIHQPGMKMKLRVTR